MAIHRPRYRNLHAFFKKNPGISMRAFAHYVKVDPSYISHILSGRRTPSLDMADVIAKEANIPIESLLERNSDK